MNPYASTGILPQIEIETCIHFFWSLTFLDPTEFHKKPVRTFLIVRLKKKNHTSLKQNETEKIMTEYTFLCELFHCN